MYISTYLTIPSLIFDLQLSFTQYFLIYSGIIIIIIKVFFYLKKLKYNFFIFKKLFLITIY